jgi:hypothetical protein
MTATKIGAIDQETAHARGTHLSEGDLLLAAEFGHGPGFRRSRIEGSRWIFGRRHVGTQSAPRRARLDSMIKHDPHRHVTHDAVHDIERITDCRWQRIAVSLSICHRVRLFCPDRIAYHSGIGVHLLIAFLLPSVCPSRIVFPWWLAYPYPTASHHRPWWYLHWLSRFHVGWIQTIEGCTPAKADRDVHGTFHEVQFVPGFSRL